jgi:hypothetical protein
MKSDEISPAPARLNPVRNDLPSNGFGNFGEWNNFYPPIVRHFSARKYGIRERKPESAIYAGRTMLLLRILSLSSVLCFAKMAEFHST